MHELTRQTLAETIRPRSVPGRTFEPVQVVLAEQRVAIRSLDARLGARSGACPPGRVRGLASAAPTDRSRLVALAMQVLVQAALAAEEECCRIVADAEAQATAIVANARGDVDRLTRWFEADLPAAAPPAPGRSADLLRATEPARSTAGLSPRAIGVSDPGSQLDAGIGNTFFDSLPATDEDPWGFMDDDLVGVGPALRRALRRPPATPSGRDRIRP